MVTESVGVPVTEKRRSRMLAQPHRAGQRQRMARARLFLGRRADPDIVGQLRAIFSST
jgi:hypothetical protein